MPAQYELQLERAAQRSLNRLSDREFVRVERAIDGLGQEPRPRGAIKLQGESNIYRLRVGDFRIIYAIFDPDSLVKVLDVRKRDDQTYRRLNP